MDASPGGRDAIEELRSGWKCEAHTAGSQLGVPLEMAYGPRLNTGDASLLPGQPEGNLAPRGEATVLPPPSVLSSGLLRALGEDALCTTNAPVAAARRSMSHPFSVGSVLGLAGSCGRRTRHEDQFRRSRRKRLGDRVEVTDLTADHGRAINLLKLSR